MFEIQGKILLTPAPTQRIVYSRPSYWHKSCQVLTGNFHGTPVVFQPHKSFSVNVFLIYAECVPKVWKLPCISLCNFLCVPFCLCPRPPPSLRGSQEGITPPRIWSTRTFLPSTINRSSLVSLRAFLAWLASEKNPAMKIVLWGSPVWLRPGNFWCKLRSLCYNGTLHR